MLKRILIGLDGSKYASSATEAGIQLAKTYNASLVGMEVLDLPGIEKHLGGAPAGAIHFAEKEKEYKLQDAIQKAQKFLQEFGQKCKAAKVRYQLFSTSGVPFKEIIEQSKVTDLTIVGLRTFYHFETQDEEHDTLKKLLDQSASPILAVPETIQPYENVLLTYDGSVQAARAIRMRILITKKMSAKYTLLTVSDDPNHNQVLLGNMAEYLKSHGIMAETISLTGDHAEAILETAKKLQPVQVVMGAYSRSSVAEFFFGSTADALVKDGTIPLFVYH